MGGEVRMARLVWGVMLYEFKRDLRKRSFILFIAFIVLPILVSLIVRFYAGGEVGGGRLWAVMMGFDIGTGLATGSVATLGIAGWIWLVAVLYGGDLFASDARDGGAQLIVIRPVGRKGYFIGKSIAVSLFLASITALAGVAAALAAITIGGPQRSVYLAPVLGALIGLGGMPILYLASLAGMALRSPIAGFIVGAAAYILTGMALSISLFAAVISGPLDLEAWKDYYSDLIYYTGIIPILAGPSLPSIIYYYIEFDNKFIPLPLPLLGDSNGLPEFVTPEITPLEVLPYYMVSTLMGIILIGYLNYYYLKKSEI